MAYQGKDILKQLQEVMQKCDDLSQEGNADKIINF